MTDKILFPWTLSVLMPAEPYLKNEYRQYLMNIVNEDW